MLELTFIQKLVFFEKLGWFIGLTCAGWLLAKLVLLVWEKAILPFAAKTESSLDDHLAKNLHRPVSRLLVLGAVYLAGLLTIAAAPELKAIIKLLKQLVYIVAMLLLTGLSNAVLKSLIDWYLQDIATRTGSTLEDTLFPILRKAGAVVIYFIGATVVLGQFKVNLAGFLATAGVASLAIAFAAQETLSNVIAGISLILDRSFHIGERIELKDGLVGDVLELGLRSTKILALDKRLIIVPNKEIADSRLINWNQPDPGCNIKLKIAVGWAEDLDKVKQLLLDVCANEELLSKTAPASVSCTGFGAYAIELLIVATVDDYKTGFTATDKLVVSLQKALLQARIQLPYPQQVIQIQPQSEKA